MKPSLNLDIPAKVSEFELLMKKVLPKQVMYRITRGKGLEFDGYRDFAPDDDASLIDWKATLRANKTLVKKFIEERELEIIFVVDVSDNMVFGSTEKLKCEYVAELVAALSHLIMISGDKIGLVLYSDDIVRVLSPAMGQRQFDTFTYELSNPKNYGGYPDLNKVLENLMDTLNKNASLIFLISDFITMGNEHKKNIKSLSSLYETIAIVVRDPLDLDMPVVNKEVVIENPETRNKMVVNPKIAGAVYRKNAQKQLENVKSIFHDSGVDHLELGTEKKFSSDLAVFLRGRIKGGRIVKNVR